MLKTGGEKLLRKNPGISLLRSATSTQTNSTKFCQNKAGELNFRNFITFRKIRIFADLKVRSKLPCSEFFQKTELSKYFLFFERLIF
jgi:hypothetical protein